MEGVPLPLDNLVTHENALTPSPLNHLHPRTHRPLGRGVNRLPRERRCWTPPISGRCDGKAPRARPGHRVRGPQAHGRHAAVSNPNQRHEMIVTRWRSHTTSIIFTKPRGTACRAGQRALRCSRCNAPLRHCEDRRAIEHEARPRARRGHGPYLCRTYRTSLAEIQRTK